MLKLRNIRVEKGFSQELISLKIGISPVSYSRKETGKREFSRTEIENISKTMKLTYKQIIEIFFAKDLPNV
jgi:transcriptional regulator with XRE-family HTH domain